MRSVPEWIGKNDDEAVPDRVKLRVFVQARGQCATCGREICAGDGKTIDHIVALVNGGANRESNLQLLCAWCEPRKTRQDVAEKAQTYATRMAHLGFRRTTRRLPHGKDSTTKRKITGEVIPR